MKTRHIVSMIVMLSVVMCSAVTATTGQINGIVTDTDGAPLAEVTITVSSAKMQGVRQYITSESGRFRFFGLPPGVYELRFECVGMRTLVRKNIHVFLSRASIVNPILQSGSPDDILYMTQPTGLLDISNSSSSIVIESDFTDRLPGTANTSFYPQMSPFVTGGDNARVGGASFTDNSWNFDGFDTTDPATSQRGSELPPEAIEQVRFQSGGFKAEHGHALGGIFQAVTRSGSNRFQGSFRWKRIDSDNRSGNKHEDWRRLRDYLIDEYAITFSGPVIQDKLWFMIAYGLSITDGETESIPSYGSAPRDSDDWARINTDIPGHMPYLKLTFRPVPEHTFVLNVSEEKTEYKNRMGNPYSTPEARGSLEYGGPLTGLEWTWHKQSDLVFVTRLGLLQVYYYDKPADGERNTPAFYDRFYGQSYNNYSVWHTNERNRLQIGSDVTYYMDDWYGSHQWKAGFEYQNLERELVNDFPGGAQYSITQVPVGDRSNPDYYTGTEATRTITLHSGPATVSADYYALYLQNDWSVTDTITLNLGLRYATITYKNNDGDSRVPAWRWGQWTADSYLTADGDFRNYAPMKLDNMIAPRVGVVWDMFGSGKTALKAFYGRYYNPFNLQLPGMFQPFDADVFATKTQEYIGPEWTDRNRDGVPDEDFFFDDANWRTTEQTEPGDWNLIDPNLSAEYTDEFLIGIEHEVLPNVTVGASFMNRRTRNMIEDVGLFVDEDGNVVWTWKGGIRDDFSGLDPNRKFDPREPDRWQDGDYAKHLYWITNVPGAKRDYYGYMLTARARRNAWNVEASYTYSRAEGTHTDRHEGSSGVAMFSSVFDTWATSQNMYGELPWSLRHYVKIAATYDVDLTDWYQMSFGINGFFRSGYHFSKRTIPPRTYDPDDHYNDINDPDTWTARPPYRDYYGFFPKGRGSYELPSTNTWDISWQNTFLFGQYGALTVIVDIINATNYQGVLRQVDTFNPHRPDLFGLDNAWAMPREYHLAVKYSF
jgi:hypothetical protein